jgi:phosphonate transport system substrate-binding protein
MTTTSVNAARRRSLATLAGVAAWLGSVGQAGAAADTPLRIGLAPYLSPAALLTAFRPMREHLERTLERPIEMVTAKDFTALIEATRRGDFDAALLPAHLSRMAVADWRFEPLAGVNDPVIVQVLVRADGPIKSPPDLRAGKIGMLDALALTATVGRQWLQELGLATSVTVVALPSINSAMIALDRGEVEAVVAGASQLMSLPAGTPRTERLLATVRNIPGPVYVAHPRLTPAEVLRLRAALVSYRPDPSRPMATANAPLQAVTADQLAPLEPFAAQARRAMAHKP